jgi:hypothetical protein
MPMSCGDGDGVGLLDGDGDGLTDGDGDGLIDGDGEGEGDDGLVEGVGETLTTARLKTASLPAHDATAAASEAAANAKTARVREPEVEMKDIGRSGLSGTPRTDAVSLNSAVARRSDYLISRER